MDRLLKGIIWICNRCSRGAVIFAFLITLIILSTVPGPAFAQTAHPTGLRGGILVPSGQTLPKGALGLLGYGTLTRVEATSANYGLVVGSLTYALTDYLQISATGSTGYQSTGTTFTSLYQATLFSAVGPFSLTLRLPGPHERPFHIAFNASVTPGIADRALTGHNLSYGRDSFDVGISLSQSLRLGSFDFRAFEGLVVTEDTADNIPSNYANLGFGVTWWAMPWLGLEGEALIRPELVTPITIDDDYRTVGTGAVLHPLPWLNVRGGAFFALTTNTSTGANRAAVDGVNRDDWMLYGSLEIVLGGVERPARPPRPEPERPEAQPEVEPVPPPIPGDSDGDGVPDDIDVEPDTPRGATVDAEGRAIDTDGDGVPDGLDAEVDTPEGAIVDAEGRALDTDSDGVPDGIDVEPETPMGAIVDSTGKAIDSDLDGVPDGIDVEPNTPRGVPVNAEGMGIYGMEAELITRGLLSLNTIYFDFNSDTIKPESYQTLREVGLILVKYSELKIEVGGHTDDSGEEEYNQLLSRVRAEAVLDWLLANIEELDLSQFTVVGYGESSPVASNDTEDGRTLNRRVEFKVLNPDELAKYRPPPR